MQCFKSLANVMAGGLKFIHVCVASSLYVCTRAHQILHIQCLNDKLKKLEKKATPSHFGSRGAWILAVPIITAHALSNPKQRNYCYDNLQAPMIRRIYMHKCIHFFVDIKGGGVQYWISSASNHTWYFLAKPYIVHSTISKACTCTCMYTKHACIYTL